MSYVTITPNSQLPSGFTYAPVECQLIEVDGSCTENCDNINAFSLFNPPEKTCDSRAELLNLAVAYDNSDSTWKFEFMLFLFNPIDVSEYKLVCDIRVCTTSADPAGT